jgi:hypothetical protein
MNAFRTVRDQLGLNSDSGTSMNNHWVYLLLSSLGDMEAANPSANTYTDPAKEVLHRLRSYQGFASQEVAKLLVPRVK